MRVRVPRDQPTLAAALASGADRIELRGTIDLPKGPVGALIDRPVRIYGGTLRGQGGWALVVGAAVELHDVTI